MIRTPKVLREDSLHPFRMFLRVHRRRSRKEVSEETIEGDRNIPTRVRMRWDDSSGSVPFISEFNHGANVLNFTSPTGAAVFQRLDPKITPPCGQMHTEEALMPSVLSNSKTNEMGETTLRVNAVKKVQQYILIDCIAGDTEAQSDANIEIKEDIYVMLADSAETQKVVLSPTSSAHSDEFDFDKLTISEKSLTSVHTIRQIGKRQRDASGSMHTFLLVPSRRERLEEGEGNIEAPSTWPPICEEHDNTLLDCIQNYEDLASLVLENSGEAKQDLYCCIDHRKDDEYDSNAEDFTGNDYPESECFDQSMSDMDIHSTAPDGSEFGEVYQASRLRADYGIFCEPDYIETSLGKGWESD